MPGILVFLRWVVIVIWCAILVLSATVFALEIPDGLTWLDFVFPAITVLAGRELWDWLA